MTQENKQLLLKDLSARLPYGVIVNFTLGDISFNERVSSVFVDECSVQVYVKQGFLKCPLDGDSEIKLSQVKPYLRPMSSMTEDELETYDTLSFESFPTKLVDWFNENHFDYRGLIPMGLALEAPVDMYKND